MFKWRKAYEDFIINLQGLFDWGLNVLDNFSYLYIFGEKCEGKKSCILVEGSWKSKL